MNIWQQPTTTNEWVIVGTHVPLESTGTLKDAHNEDTFSFPHKSGHLFLELFYLGV